MQGATEWDRYVEEGVGLVSATAQLFPGDVVELLVRLTRLLVCVVAAASWGLGCGGGHLSYRRSLLMPRR